jgi:Peptidase family M28/WD40-like Beta Propeller Repeat
MRRLSGTALMVAALWVSMSGDTANPKLRDAELAWDRGDYPAALSGYLALLNSTEAEQVLEPIALQTGELFHTIELTSDGGTPRFSPDGRYLTYEIGRGIGRKIRLASSETPSQAVAELAGHGAAFSPDGSHLAYLKITPTPAMLEIEASLDTLTGAERTARLAQLTQATETAAQIIVRDLVSGTEREIDLGTRRKNDVRLGADNTILFTGSETGGGDQIYLVGDGRPPAAITTGEPDKILQQMNATGTAALFTQRAQGGRGTAPPSRFGVVALPQGNVTMLTGSAPAFSADGRMLAYVARAQELSQLMVAPSSAPATGAAVRSGSERLDAPALSRDAGRIAFQMMPKEDWELYSINRDGSGEQRITREIQHDLAPRFLPGDRLIGLIGEPRHRRSYLYDLSTNTRKRIFHNNTVRTIAPEYEWVPSPDGTKLVIVAERDGDTVSPERGVYLTDLAKKVTVPDVRARVQASLAAEEALRAKGKRLYAPIADDVRRAIADASIGRVYGYEKSLFDFDSKHISRPGNKLAASYLFDTYKSFGYEPEYQWFAGRGALGGQTANVVATLKGTVNPELVYVVSSHYDSVAIGPGADDDSSGTSALLESARLLAKHPQPATIVFASFTGEEAGLLGSREFVRRAVADKMQVVGALNNDMIGWANDHRLDDTIRYSNPGIRDVQHAAAIQFTNLITYDALYYKGTDAHTYYEAYGDIVGGLGSYPVLGNPHYHQSHDVLETINHQLVTEVAKTTTATLMLLASSPSRLKDLKIERYENGTATLTWSPSPEKGVTGYIVAWGPPDKPESEQLRVTRPAASIKASPGSTIAVKAVNQKGLEGWDGARATVKTESK